MPGSADQPRVTASDVESLCRVELEAVDEISGMRWMLRGYARVETAKIEDGFGPYRTTIDWDNRGAGPALVLETHEEG